MQLLISVCRELQRLNRMQPFFLTCRDAERLTGIAYKIAHKLLTEALVADGILELVSRGKQHARKANRYRFVGGSL